MIQVLKSGHWFSCFHNFILCFILVERYQIHLVLSHVNISTWKVWTNIETWIIFYFSFTRICLLAQRQAKFICLVFGRVNINIPRRVGYHLRHNAPVLTVQEAYHNIWIDLERNRSYCLLYRHFSPYRFNVLELLGLARGSSSMVQYSYE